MGKWLELQRQVQAGQRPGRLTAEQAAKLEKLGIRWNHRLEAAWEKGFASAQKYRTEHGDLLVPVRYRDKNDFALGEWIVYNRQRYLGGNLTQNRIERLEAIGMVWSTSNDLWEQNYAAATQYYLEHGNLEVPIKYETPSGFGLGVWLGAQRRRSQGRRAATGAGGAAGRSGHGLDQPQRPQVDVPVRCCRRLLP